MVQRRTCGGSESDAYRYTKKVLGKLKLSTERIEKYMKQATELGESSWYRHCFNMLRQRFFHNGQSSIRYAPGVARIAYGELDMDDDWEEDNSLINLDVIIRMISQNHADDYNRHLNGINYKELNAKYGVQVSDNLEELKNQLRKRSYGPRRYKVIWMSDYTVGQPYYKYTTECGGNWCYLNGAGTFKGYENGGSTKLYIALMEGFETMSMDDPNYGASMLGIDIGPNGELIHVNNRWNHAHDNIDERKGDNKYTAEELSDLLGGPYFEICPPYNETELLSKGFTKLSFGQILATAKRGIFVDPRDGHKYHTIRLCNRTWICENIQFTKSTDGSIRIPREGYGYNTNHFEYGPYYRGDYADMAVPPGCRLASSDDWNSLGNFCKMRKYHSYFNAWFILDDTADGTIVENPFIARTDNPPALVVGPTRIVDNPTPDDVMQVVEVDRATGEQAVMNVSSNEINAVLAVHNAHVEFNTDNETVTIADNDTGTVHATNTDADEPSDEDKTVDDAPIIPAPQPEEPAPDAQRISADELHNILDTDSDDGMVAVHTDVIDAMIGGDADQLTQVNETNETIFIHEEPISETTVDATNGETIEANTATYTTPYTTPANNDTITVIDGNTEEHYTMLANTADNIVDPIVLPENHMAGVEIADDNEGVNDADTDNGVIRVGEHHVLRGLRSNSVPEALNRCKMSLLGFGSGFEGIATFAWLEQEGNTSAHWVSDVVESSDYHTMPEPSENYDNVEDQYYSMAEYEMKYLKEKYIARRYVNIGKDTMGIRTAPIYLGMCIKCIVND